MAAHKGSPRWPKKIMSVVAVFALLGLTLIAGGSTASATESQAISAKALTDHSCDSSEWHFVITQVRDRAKAPSSITVSWANGETKTVTLDKFTGGVAHYATTSNLASAVTSATTRIYPGWSGQFNLSHGPCRETPPPQPTCINIIKPGDVVARYTTDAFHAVVEYKGKLPLCEGVSQVVSLNSYATDGPSWPTSGTQVFVDHDQFTLDKDHLTGTLEVTDPGCFYQTDLYWGSTRYDGVDGALPHYPDVVTPYNLIAARNGGEKCEPPPVEPEGALKVSSSCESITFSTEGVKPEGAEQVVKLDGVVKAPGTYEVTPGEHTVELFVDGKKVDSETVTVAECESPPTDACPDLPGNQPEGAQCTQPRDDRETRDLPGVVDCQADTVTVQHQERTRAYAWDGEAWKAGQWSEWTTYDTTVTKATDDQCPPPPVIQPCPVITGTTMVTPRNLQGFDFSETRSTGHFEFTENGLHIWTEGATSTDKVAGYKQVDVPLAAVGEPSLTYSATAGGQPGFQLYLDNGQGVAGFVVGEPSAYGDNWWSTKDFGVGAGMGYASYGTLNDYLVANPDARVKAFGFSLGSGVKGEGLLSKIIFGCEQWVFTADKTPPPPPPPPPTPTPGTASASSEGCVKPGESTGAVNVTVTNADDETNGPVTYDVKLGSETKQVTVNDGASGTVRFTGLPAGEYDWTATGADGTKVADTVTVTACDVPPPPPPVLTCPEGSSPFDIDGDGQLELPEECMADEVMPPEGNVSIVPGCGFVTVTNRESVSLTLLYGRFDRGLLDGEVTIKPGESREIKTARHSLDWMAVWAGDKFFAYGENVVVDQDCDTAPPAPQPPAPTPPVSPPTHPTTAPHAGMGAGGGFGLAAFAALAGLGTATAGMLGLWAWRRFGVV